MHSERSSCTRRPRSRSFSKIKYAQLLPYVYTVFILCVSFVIFVLVFIPGPRPILPSLRQWTTGTSIPGITSKNDLGSILELNHFSIGAEYGVGDGMHTSTTLSSWRSCKTFYAIDSWINLNSTMAEVFKNRKKFRLNTKDLPPELSLITLDISDALDVLGEGMLDYVYFHQGQHYCGSPELLSDYWKKIRPGGFMGGGDYLTCQDMAQLNSSELIDIDCSICNTTEALQSIIEVVDTFTVLHSLTLSVLYREGNRPSWILKKPLF